MPICKGSVKWLLMLLIIVSLTALSACQSAGNQGSGNAESDQGAANAASSQAAEEKGNAAADVGADADANAAGKYDPPIEVTAVRDVTNLVKFIPGEDMENNPWSRTYEDELGIKIKYLWTADPSEYYNKLNTMIASGTLADILPVDKTTLQRLIDADLIADLTEVGKQASDFVKEVWESDDGRAIQAATFDGKLMAIPMVESAINQGDMIWVRRDWLRKLNLPEPKTMADLLAVSEAFTNRDPDGNGKKDTYGLGMQKELFGTYAGLTGFMNGYHAYPNIWTKDDSGALVYGSIQPQVKLALQKLQEMYKSGQIDLEFAVKDQKKSSELVVNGNVGLLFGSFRISVDPLQPSMLNDPNADWIPLPLASIDDTPAKKTGGFSAVKFYAVSKTAKHPEAVVKLVDAYLAKMAEWGPRAQTHFGSAPDGINRAWYALVLSTPAQKDVINHRAIVKSLTTKDEAYLKEMQTGDGLDNYKMIQEYMKTGDRNLWFRNIISGIDGALSVIDTHYEEDRIVYDEYYGPPTATMIKQNALLNDLQTETFSKIIMGALPVDEFDNFVKQWMELGGKTMTEEVNEWYKSRQ